MDIGTCGVRSRVFKDLGVSKIAEVAYLAAEVKGTNNMYDML